MKKIRFSLFRSNIFLNVTHKIGHVTSAQVKVIIGPSIIIIFVNASAYIVVFIRKVSQLVLRMTLQIGGTEVIIGSLICAGINGPFIIPTPASLIASTTISKPELTLLSFITTTMQMAHFGKFREKIIFYWSFILCASMVLLHAVWEVWLCWSPKRAAVDTVLILRVSLNVIVILSL